MSESRIPPVPADDPVAMKYGRAPGGGQGPPLNIFRTLAHNEPLLRGFVQLGGHLLGTGVIPAREREVVILRVGWRCGSEYEFGQHSVIGRRAGLSDEEITRLAQPELDGWSDGDRPLVQLADELCADDRVRDATWAALAARWDEAQLLELLVLAGYYRLVSGLLNSVGVALEAQTPGWPDGATGPRAPREGAA